MRIAIIDIGTNSTRLFVADMSNDQVSEELKRISRVTRLGAGVDASGRLAPDSIEREFGVLADYRRHLDELRPDRAIAVMTSAVRDASNGPEFAELVASRFKFEPHIISGDEEARLTYIGATDTPAGTPGDQRTAAGTPGDQRTMVFDIGGGSTEIVIGHGDHLDFHVSTQAGVVRQAERHITNDPPTAGELELLSREIHEILEAAVPATRRAGIERALGVAGTPTSLASIAQQLDPYDADRVHGYELSAGERDEIFDRLVTMPLEQRQRVVGLHPDRALVLIPGIVILKAVMDLFALQKIEVSEHDILRGAAIAFSAGTADRETAGR